MKSESKVNMVIFLMPSNATLRCTQKVSQLLIAACCLLVSSCDLINPEEAIPTYLNVQPFQFQTQSSIEGTANQRITEGWLTVDGEFLGVYNLPATIPVLTTGTVEVKIEAGIKDNGISALTEIYPFFTDYTTTETLTAGETLTINPVTSYRSNVTFGFIEDFEGNGSIFLEDLDGNPATAIANSTILPFEGNQSGLIQLDKDNPVVKIATDLNNTFSGLQTQQPFVYLEVNYRTDVEMAFGLIGFENGVGFGEEAFASVLFPRSDWNKVYLNVSEIAFLLPQDAYQIVFLAALPDNLDSAEIHLDNIKFLYF